MRLLMLQPTTACRSRHLGCRPTKGILWLASACRIAAWLYGMQVAWPPSSPSPPPPSTPTSRLGLVNHLQPAWEGNQIWLQRRNPVVYWNKSSHGACCNGETGVTPSGAGRRRLDSASVTLYWSQYAGDTKWTLMTMHRWNSTCDTKWHSSASDQGLITRNCSLIQEIQTLMEVMLRLISVSPLMFDIYPKNIASLHLGVFWTHFTGEMEGHCNAAFIE